MQQVMQGEQIQRKTEEQIRSVNQTQNTGEDGAEKVKDRGAGQQQESDRKKKEKQQEKPDEEEPRVFVFRDPRQGRNIDISL